MRTETGPARVAVPPQAIQIIIGALILCLSASVLQIHEVHFTEDVFLFLIVVIQVTILPSYRQQNLSNSPATSHLQSLI